MSITGVLLKSRGVLMYVCVHHCCVYIALRDVHAFYFGVCLL